MVCVSEHYESYFTEWESLEALCSAWEYKIPQSFNAGRFLCDRWAADETKTALQYEDWTTDSVGTYTFRELTTVTNKLANTFEHYGLRKGDRLAINVSRKREALISYIAAWKVGLVTVPLSTLFGPDGLRYRLEDSGARLAVVDASNVDAYRRATEPNDAIECSLLVGDADIHDGEIDFWEALERASGEYDIADTTAEDDLILLYTSGTTGEPKGVRHAHKLVFGHMPAMITNGYNLELYDDDVYWTPTEFSWAGTLCVILGAWSFGVTLVAFESGESFDAERGFSVIERYDVTAASIPPSALRMMMQVEHPADRFDLSRVRVVASGGESLHGSVQEWAKTVFDAPVHESYGQTEICTWPLGDCNALFEPSGDRLGRQLPGHEVAIVDPDTAERVASGEIGEIALRRDDPAVLRSYWNAPEKTAAKFSGEWVLTGDLGMRDSEGWFTFVSRKDDIIISSGYRISPVEVEESVASHEAVADAGVIGVPDDERGTIVKAFVVLASDYEPTADLEERIQDHVRRNLAAYEYPRRIEFVSELPRTSTGKIRRTSLRERDGLESL